MEDPDLDEAVALYEEASKEFLGVGDSVGDRGAGLESSPSLLEPPPLATVHVNRNRAGGQQASPSRPSPLAVSLRGK